MYKGERDKRGGSAVTDPDLEIRGGGGGDPVIQTLK